MSESNKNKKIDITVEEDIYKDIQNKKNKIDGLKLLGQLHDNTIKTAFFDPQYRGILDKMNYGNEGESRGKARCDLQQMDEEIIIKFINEIDRVLSPSGHLFLWVDKFHLCTGVLDWFSNTSLQLVDLITWDKDKIGMGYRTKRKSEYLIVFQKEPKRAKDVWKSHSIPDVWVEKVNKTHAHSKPINLQKALIEATTEEGDYVLDPASGGYSVFEACKLCKRTFIGGDIQYGENQECEA